MNLTVDPFSFAGDLELFKVAGNVTSLNCEKFSIGKDTEMFQLHDGYVTFDLNKFILDFSIGYEFILDPPIMADIGFLNISVDNLEIKANTSTFVENNDLNLNMTYLKIAADSLGIEFDGLNDFLYEMNGLINTIGGIVLGKAGSVIEDDLPKIIPLINKLLGMIPDSFPIPGTHLSFDLAFASTPISREGIDL